MAAKSSSACATVVVGMPSWMTRSSAIRRLWTRILRGEVRRLGVETWISGDGWSITPSHHAAVVCESIAPGPA